MLYNKAPVSPVKVSILNEATGCVQNILSGDKTTRVADTIISEFLVRQSIQLFDPVNRI